MFILKKWSEENRRKKDEDYDTSKKEVEKKEIRWIGRRKEGK
jgi:hypothetical protein